MKYDRPQAFAGVSAESGLAALNQIKVKLSRRSDIRRSGQRAHLSCVCSATKGLCPLQSSNRPTEAAFRGCRLTASNFASSPGRHDESLGVCVPRVAIEAGAEMSPRSISSTLLSRLISTLAYWRARPRTN